jgi:hypothetical protein
MTPIYEVKMVPKDPKASIVYIILRVDDPENIYDTDTLINFIEKQFPGYRTDHVIAGYKRIPSETNGGISN